MHHIHGLEAPTYIRTRLQGTMFYLHLGAGKCFLKRTNAQLNAIHTYIDVYVYIYIYILDVHTIYMYDLHGRTVLAIKRNLASLLSPLPKAWVGFRMP